MKREKRDRGTRALPDSCPAFLAHRGASSLAPENTIAAFAAARALNCAGVELDIHLTADGELVVTHDHWLDRIAGIHRRVEEMTLEELRAVDAGSFFNALHPDAAVPSYASEKIPTLDEALETIGADAFVDLELKLDSLHPRPLAEAAATCLARHARDNAIVSSFNPLALLAYRAHGPHATAAIYCPYRSVPFYLRHRECLWFSLADIKKPAREHALESERYETGKKPVIAWTVDSMEEARAMLEGGVRAVITNRIEAVPADLKGYIPRSSFR